jgi:hypothetical protein
MDQAVQKNMGPNADPAGNQKGREAPWAFADAIPSTSNKCGDRDKNE